MQGDSIVAVCPSCKNVALIAEVGGGIIEDPAPLPGIEEPSPVIPDPGPILPDS